MQNNYFFFSTCKQVSFINETFRQLTPGIQLMAIHGKISHKKRLETYYKFLEKQNACLFATDIAARGLDFPNVDWILQFDCPENVDQYIHRCGRTARYRSNGNALLFLLPSEKKFLDQLENSKITVKFSKISPSMLKQSLQGHMSSCVASSPEIKFLGQKAFITYMRSVFLQGNKEVFDVHALPAAELAKSMGLPGTPRIKFIKAIKIPKKFN